MKRAISYILAICMLLSLCIVPAGAVETRASLYLDAYYVDATAVGNGKIVFDFDVDATRTVDVVGATRILVQEKNEDGDWDNVKTYYSGANPDMLAYDTNAHEGSVTYKGTVGKTYRAQIIVHAGDSNGEDSRILYTVEATAY